MARNTYEIDENLETPFDIEKLKRIGKYVAPYKMTIVFILFLMATSSIATMFIPVIFMKAMDVSIPNKDMNQIVRLSIYILAISLYVSIVLKVRTQVMTKMGQNIFLNTYKDYHLHILIIDHTGKYK